LEDHLAQSLKELAHRSGKPFKVVVNDTLRKGLHVSREPKARSYRVVPASLGGVLPGVDLRKALQVADALEDRAIAEKLAQRK